MRLLAHWFLVATTWLLVGAACSNLAPLVFDNTFGARTLTDGDYNTSGMAYGLSFCVYTVTTGNASLVQRARFSFSLGTNADTLLFYDGASSAPLLSRAQRDGTNYNVFTTQPSITMVLWTDGFLPKSGGFSVVVTAVVPPVHCALNQVVNYVTLNSFSEPAAYTLDEPLSYRRNTVCSWIIPLQPGHVSLGVRLNGMTPTALSPGDAVYVYAGTDDRAPLIGAIGYGNEQFKNYYSTSNVTYVKFVSLDTDKLGLYGFTLQFFGFSTPVHCSGRVVVNVTSTSSSQIVEPTVGMFNGFTYAPGLNCEWELRAAPGKAISFNILQTDMQLISNFARLTVYDGATNSSRQIMNTDSFNTKIYSSSSNVLLLSLWTHPFWEGGNGIAVYYRRIDAPVMSPPPVTYFTVGSGTIGVPNPVVDNTPYLPNQDVRFVFTRMYANRLGLAITRVSLNAGDYVTIYTMDAGGQTTPYRNLTGTGPYDLSQMMFPDAGAMVYFHSGPVQGSAPGFTMNYQFFNLSMQCNGTTAMSNTGVLSISGNVGWQLYATPLNCTWAFRASPGRVGYLLVQSWDLRPGDRLTVYDGNNMSALQLVNLTGTTPLDNSLCQEIYGTSRDILVTLTSNASSWLLPGNTSNWGVQANFNSPNAINPTGCSAVPVQISLALGQSYIANSMSGRKRNQDCQWNISRSDYVGIGFQFGISINMHPATYVYIYDGPTTDSPILFYANATYNTLYSNYDSPITSTQPVALVRYVTGWYATPGFNFVSISVKGADILPIDMQSRPYTSFPLGRCNSTGVVYIPNVPYNTFYSIYSVANSGIGLQSNMHCRWLIDAGVDPSTGTALQLGRTFPFGDPKNEAPFYPGLYSWAAYDGPDNNSPVLLDHTSAFYRVASQRYIFIEFNTSTAQQWPTWGMRLRFMRFDIPVPCSGLDDRFLASTADVGYYKPYMGVGSWNFPEPSVCAWHFTTVPGAFFVFSNIQEMLAGAETMTMYDGDSPASPLLYQFNATSLNPFALRTTGSSVYFVYDTHGVSMGGGFGFRVEPIFMPSTCQGGRPLYTTQSPYSGVLDGTAQLPPRPDPNFQGPYQISLKEYSYLFGEVPNTTCVYDMTIPYGDYITTYFEYTLPDGYIKLENNGQMISYNTGIGSSQSIDGLCGNITFTVNIGPNAGAHSSFRIAFGLWYDYQVTPGWVPRCQAPGDQYCDTNIDAYSQADLLPYLNCTVLSGGIYLGASDRYSMPNLRVVHGTICGSAWAGNGVGALSFPALSLLSKLDLSYITIEAFSLPSLVFVNDFHMFRVSTPVVNVSRVYASSDLTFDEMDTVTIIDLSGFRFNGYNFMVSECTELVTLMIGALERTTTTLVDGSFKLRSADFSSLRNFNVLTVRDTKQAIFALPSYTNASYMRGGLELTSLTNLNTIDLSQAPGLLFLTLATAPQLDTVLVPRLGYIYGAASIDSVRLTTIQMPALSTLKSFTVSSSTILSQVLMPSLTAVATYSLQDTMVTSLALPNLRTILSSIFLLRNYQLSVLDMCNLTSSQNVTVTQCPKLSCQETQFLFGDVGSVLVDASAPNCDADLLGTFGCRENQLRIVNTTKCEFTLACIQVTIDEAYIDKGTRVYIPSGVYTGCSTPLDTHGKAITVFGSSTNSGTVLDCAGAGRAMIIQSAESPRTVIAGITISNGAATTGGAVLVTGNAAPTFQNVTFSASTAMTTGGAVMITSNAAPAFFGCDFTQNAARQSGGALAVNGGSVSLIGCNFAANQAVLQGGAVDLISATSVFITTSVFVHNAAQQGGALFSDGAIVISGSNFTANTASQFGGALASVPADLDINPPWSNLTGVIFLANRGETGGALYGFSSHMQLTAVTFDANEADLDGGAITALCAPSYKILQRVRGTCPFYLHLDDVAMTNNVAGGNGGGLSITSVRMTQAGGSLVANSAGLSGGGIYATATLVTSRGGAVVASNAALNNGGGIYCEPFAGSCDVMGAVIRGNSAGVTGGGVYMCTAACANTTIASLTLPQLQAVNAFSANLVAAGGYGAAISTDPTHLAWEITADSNVISGRAVSSSGNIAVDVTDSFDNLVTSSNNLLAVSLDVTLPNGGVAPSALQVSGANTALALRGSATFSGVTLQAPLELTGATYLLRAKLSTGVFITSSVFLAPCAEGQGRATASGPLVCVNCLAGSAGSAALNYSCVQCTPGHYSPAALTPACLPCPAGTHASLSGASQCEACLAGYQALEEGMADCVPIPVDPVAASSGSAAAVDSASILVPILAASGGVLLLIIIGAICLWRLARRKTMQKYYLDSDSTIRASGMEETPLMKSVKKILGASTTTRAGGGMFADVYKAKWETGAWIALKVIRKEMMGSMEAQSEFRREAVALSRLSEVRHRGIVGLVFFLERNPMCVAMEFCERGTLKRHLVTNTLSVADKVRIAAEIASAMAASHARDVVHLDLKTDNVLLDEECHIKLADFGISRITGGQGGDGLTKPRRSSTVTSAAPPYATTMQIDSTRGGGEMTNNPLFADNDGAVAMGIGMGSLNGMNSQGSSDLASITSGATAGQTNGAGANGAFTPQYVDPLRIMESTIQDDAFLRRTDVFSYGILMWAIFKQEEPYAGVPPESLIADLKTNPAMRPPPIDNIHVVYGNVMSACWHNDAAARPEFAVVARQLQDCLRTEFGAELGTGYSVLPL